MLPIRKFGGEVDERAATKLRSCDLSGDAIKQRFYLPARGALVLQASNMQALPANKTYELWVIPATGAPIPAGLFRPDASGSGSVVLPEIPHGVQAKAFGITIENAGGASTPTMPIVLSGAAPAAGE